MKKFQPLNATEHLQALYAAGEDWAQEVLEAYDAYWSDSNSAVERSEELEAEVERLGRIIDDLNEELEARELCRDS